MDQKALGEEEKRKREREKEEGGLHFLIEKKCITRRIS
jgi:hypothetical protein